MVGASLVGTRNVLRWAGMLPGEMEPITGIQVVHPGFAVRRTMTLRAPTACIALHLKEAGDMVQAGEAVAELRDVWGRPLPESPLLAQHDGFVWGRGMGIYYYPGDTVLHLAIRDENPLVGPYPDDYFKPK
jgi:predicted deacylase